MATNQDVATIQDVIYQNCLALDYLLTAEGGMCGKLNLSNCCLQIDDKGKVIEEITRKMTNMAHVPVQTGRDVILESYLGGWFSYLGGFKTLGFKTNLLLFPCLLPLFVRRISSLAEAVANRKATTLFLALKGYQPRSSRG